MIATLRVLSVACGSSEKLARKVRVSVDQSILRIWMMAMVESWSISSGAQGLSLWGHALVHVTWLAGRG